MRKLKTCYKTEVTIPTDAELNFCFRDADGNWDNNYGKDYTYTVSTTAITPASTYTTVEVHPYFAKTTKK